MTTMQLNIFFLCRAIIITILPIAAKKFKAIYSNDQFKLSDLSKLYGIWVVFYLIRIIILNIFSFGMDGRFWFERLYYGLGATTVFVIGIMIYSPLRHSKETLISFPLIRKKSSLYMVVLIFFLFVCSSMYLGVTSDPQKMLQNDAMIVYQFINNFYSSFALFLTTAVYAIIGEELVFRYFTINALRSFINSDKIIIIISSIIWTLMHTSFNYSIFIVGIFLGYFYVRTGYLSLSICFHFIYNITISTTAFYIYFSGQNFIGLTPLQYSLGIFFLIIIFYHLIEYLIGKPLQKEKCKI